MDVDFGLYGLLNQLLLPLFIMALLFGFAGVSPDLVVRSFTSVLLSLVGHIFGICQSLLSLIFRRSRYPK